MYYVYILFSEKDRLLYTGFTPDLKARFERHTKGFVKATKQRRPLKLIYYEDGFDARRREIFLKGGKGKSELRIQLQEIFRKLKYKQFEG